MRRRAVVFAVLLFFMLGPAVFFLCILSASGHLTGGQPRLVLTLCAFVLLVFGLLAMIASTVLCRKLSATPGPHLVDSLTGLLSRAAAEAQIRTALAAPPEGACALILADIRGLHTVNERLGYEGGDRLLCALADVLRTQLSDMCIAGRVAHDTFLLFVPGLSGDKAEQAVSQRLQALAESWPRLLSSPEASLAPDVGIALGAVWSPHGVPFEALYSGADRALLRCHRTASPYLLQKLS